MEDDRSDFIWGCVPRLLTLPASQRLGVPMPALAKHDPAFSTRHVTIVYMGHVRIHMNVNTSVYIYTYVSYNSYTNDAAVQRVGVPMRALAEHSIGPHGSALVGTTSEVLYTVSEGSE